MNSMPTTPAMDTSYLAQQVNAIVGQLHGLFDEIGVPGHERECRESELFEALSDALHNQVRIVTNEKKGLIEEAQRMITAIRQMEASLDDGAGRREEELRISFPLSRCLQILKEKHAQVSKLHKERFEQVKKLVEALESYSSHLEPAFVRIKLPPTGPDQPIPPSFDVSPSYVDKLDQEFTRVYEEYSRRVAAVQALANQIIDLWAELGTPQAQTDQNILRYYRDAPEQLGLHEEDVARLRARRDRLDGEKKTREKKLQSLRSAVEGLWQKLGVEEGEQKSFLNANRGCGVRQVNEFEAELARLDELKRQNLHLFVEDARCKLQELWDALHFSEDEMLEFTPAFSDVYSDALLEAHERETARLEALREQRAPMLALIEKHRALAQERDELAASSQDASRLTMKGQKGEKRDPGKLLREEKMRKRIAKELPKIEAELRRALEQWEEEYGRPYLVHGEPYLSVMAEEQPQQQQPQQQSQQQTQQQQQQQQQQQHTGGYRAKTPLNSRNGNGTGTGTGTLGRSNSTAVVRSTAAPPPPRTQNKTPVGAGHNSLQRSQSQSHRRQATALLPPQTTVANAKGSPTRLPARAPLSNLKNGNNSPERPKTESAHARNGPPTRAPPPKMRDLGAVPELEPAPATASYGGAVGLESSFIRAVEPDDDDEDDDDDDHHHHHHHHVYDGHPPEFRHLRSNTASQRHQQPRAGAAAVYGEGEPRGPTRSKSVTSSSQSSNHNSSSGYEDYRPLTAQSGMSSTTTTTTASSSSSSRPTAPRRLPAAAHASSSAAAAGREPPRQTSGSSHASTTASGSENWETYDDSGSEPELDASDTYYAKVQAARGRTGAAEPPEHSHSYHQQQQQQHHHHYLHGQQEHYSYHAHRHHHSQHQVQDEDQATIKAFAAHGYRLPADQSKPYRGLPPSRAGHVTVDAEGNQIISGGDWEDEEAF